MSDLIPQGTYEAVAYPVDTEEFGSTYVQFGESKKMQTPFVTVNTEIVGGDCAGRRIAYIGYFAGGATQRTIESLRYFGFKGNDLAAAVSQTLDQKVEIVVEHEEYDGKVRAKVTWVNRLGGGALKLAAPMSKDAFRRFAASMKAAVTAVPDDGSRAAGSGGQQARPASRPQPGQQRLGSPPPREEAPPVDDSDIPF